MQRGWSVIQFKEKLPVLSIQYYFIITIIVMISTLDGHVKIFSEKPCLWRTCTAFVKNANANIKKNECNEENYFN